MNDFGKLHRRQIIAGGYDKPVSTWRVKRKHSNGLKAFSFIIVALLAGWLLATILKVFML